MTKEPKIRAAWSQTSGDHTIEVTPAASHANRESGTASRGTRTLGSRRRARTVMAGLPGTFDILTHGPSGR